MNVVRSPVVYNLFKLNTYEKLNIYGLKKDKNKNYIVYRGILALYKQKSNIAP